MFGFFRKRKVICSVCSGNLCDSSKARAEAAEAAEAKYSLDTEVKVIPEPEVESKYWIDHYPKRGVYYPRYGDSYMKTCFNTGVIKLDSDDFTGKLYGDRYSGVEGKENAKKKIKEYEEQQDATLRVRIEVGD